MRSVNRRVLPGLAQSLGFTLFYLGALVLIPLVACVVKAFSLTPAQFWAAVWTERARSAFAKAQGRNKKERQGALLCVLELRTCAFSEAFH
jgi:sulfate/thiosulfate transport system permease protein